MRCPYRAQVATEAVAGHPEDATVEGLPKAEAPLAFMRISAQIDAI